MGEPARTPSTAWSPCEDVDWARAYLGHWPGLAAPTIESFCRLCALCPPGAAGLTIALHDLAAAWAEPPLYPTTVMRRLRRLADLGLLLYQAAGSEVSISLVDPRRVEQRPVGAVLGWAKRSPPRAGAPPDAQRALPIHDDPPDLAIVGPDGLAGDSTDEHAGDSTDEHAGACMSISPPQREPAAETPRAPARADSECESEEEEEEKSNGDPIELCRRLMNILFGDTPPRLDNDDRLFLVSLSLAALRENWSDCLESAARRTVKEVRRRKHSKDPILNVFGYLRHVFAHDLCDELGVAPARRQGRVLLRDLLLQVRPDAQRIERATRPKREGHQQ